VNAIDANNHAGNAIIHFSYMRKRHHHTYYVRGMFTETPSMTESAIEKFSKTAASYVQQDLFIPSYKLRLLDSIGQGK